MTQLELTFTGVADMTKLEELAAEVADDQAAIEVDSEDTRTRVKRMGKKLLRMQKEQKKEQRKGETDQTWQEFCEDQKRSAGAFPDRSACQRYMRIATYPAAYEKGMTIHEAYKMACAWKKNGGNPPEKLKVTVPSRRLVTVNRMAGKLEDKIEKLLEKFDTTQEDEGGWSKDEMEGCLEQFADHAAERRSVDQKVECVDLERRFPSFAVAYEAPSFTQTQDPWHKVLKCRWGHISPAGGSKLWACTKSRGVVIKKLLAAGGIMRMDGDDGVNVEFDLVEWRVFFKIMGAK